MDIIQNSIRAIKMKGGDVPGLIKLKTFAEDKQVILEIEDDGIGIEKENINKIPPVLYNKGCGRRACAGIKCSL
jgi:signal transduction histidine kinase